MKDADFEGTILKNYNMPSEEERVMVKGLKRRRRNKWIVGLSSLTLLAYAATCIPNSIDLSKKLEPLRKEFRNVVAQGYDHAYYRGYHNVELDFGGRLEEVIKKRDKVLNENYGISGRWTAMDYKPSSAEISFLVFCYNPFHKVK